MILSNECILWTGSLDTGGYGLKRRKGKLYKAHRLAWEDKHGPIPEGMMVCHTCDVRACVETEHMFLGTNSDNMLDMYAKGRGNGFFKYNNPSTKLTRVQHEEIFALKSSGLYQRVVAEMYGIDRTRVSQIWRKV